MKQIIVVALSVLAASCQSQNNPFRSDQFVPVTHGERLYVINSRTGKTFQLKDGKRFDVSEPDLDLQKLLDEFENRKVRFESKLGNPSLMTVSGMAKPIAEQPKVLAKVTPYVESIKELTGTVFSLQFVDSDGFELSREAVSVSDFTSSIDGEGGYVGFSIQKDLRIPMEEFRLVSSVGVIWYDELDGALTAWLETDAGQQWRQSKDDSKGADAE